MKNVKGFNNFKLNESVDKDYGDFRNYRDINEWLDPITLELCKETIIKELNNQGHTELDSIMTDIDENAKAIMYNLNEMLSYLPEENPYIFEKMIEKLPKKENNNIEP